jgi:dCMP deaminase
MKNKFIKYYMDVAQLTSTLSYATRLQVGAVIVKGHKILATGYNGMPAGWDNNCEDEIGHVLDDANNIVETRLKTKQEVLHAESNALMKVASSTESSENSTMFCTHAPCIHCAKLIYQSGINSLYYRNTYRDTAGLEFLEKSGVSVTQYCT